MALPACVKIGTITYTVIECDRLDGNHLGELQYGAAEIRLKRDMPDDVKLSVFVHEVLHGIAESTGQKHREGEIDGFAHGLVRLFEDNGWRIEYE